MKKEFFILSLILLAILLTIGMASAADSDVFYVDNNLGSDLSDGSKVHPWKTINHAAEMASQGDSVLIASGTYHLTENIHITNGGNQTNPIVFSGQGKVIIDGSGLDGSNYSKRDAIFIENSNYIIIKNLEVKNAYRAGIRVSGSDHVTIKTVLSHDNGNWGIFTDFSNYLLIENCECYGSKREHGIYVSNSGDYPIIRGNTIHDNHGCGLHMNGDISMGGDGVISHAQVENNIIYNNGVGGGSGINCDGVTNSIIRNNLLHNNHANGISLYCIDGGTASVNNQIYDNTVLVALDGRWALNLKDSSSNNVVYNNILLNKNPSHGSISTDSILGLKCDYNILSTNSHPVTPDDETSYPSFSRWKTLGFDQHSNRATPEQLFMNPHNNDYNLRKNCVAIDKGTSQLNCTMDILGNTRPYDKGYDIGAYEKISKLIKPSELTYLGAFRLPDNPGDMGWEWAGVEMGAITYYPDGDPDGISDGFPGSLYGTGHDQLKYISEISIPQPIVSITKNTNDLKIATTLQEFTNVLGNRIQGMELPKIGLQYLEMQGNQTSGKIYYCYGQHIQDTQYNPSHGWYELDLSNPKVSGDWKIDNLLNYLTTYYIFSISQTWATIYTPNMYLATGRFRDGGQGSQGPTIFAYGPWNQGNPPASGTVLETIPLLQYSSVTDPESHVMDNYAHSDEWNGGAWLTSGDMSSVIFVGTKGIGNTWYGFSDGTKWPTSGQGPFPDVPDISPTFYGEDLRGWWSDSFQAQILFYDPEDLAAVSLGTMQPYEPQPYAVLDIDPYLFNLTDPQQKDRIGGVAFDSERGYLYVMEPLADGDKSIIHVWKINTSDTTSPVVTTSNPVNNAVNVSKNLNITITFSEIIKEAPEYGVELKNSSGTSIPFTSSISGNVLTIDPLGDLAESLYTLTIHTGAVTDLAGNPVALIVSKFSVGTSPHINNIDPANKSFNVRAAKTIKVTFNEAIKMGSDLWIKLINSSGTLISTIKSINGNLLIIDPVNNLTESQYTLIIHTGAVTDLAGNPVTLISSKFSVGNSPMVTSTTPLNNKTGFSRTAKITVKFNESVYSSNYYGKITIKNQKTGEKVAVIKSISGTYLYLKTSLTRSANTWYQVTIPAAAVKDRSGNKTIKAYSFKFKTGI